MSGKESSLLFICNAGPKDCVKLQVPETTETTARLRWRMQYDEQSVVAVDTYKNVAIRSMDPIHIIQTDKAWYVPGQLLRFRILSLNHLLYPILDKVREANK